jgi:hypothetical protein
MALRCRERAPSTTSRAPRGDPTESPPYVRFAPKATDFDAVRRTPLCANCGAVRRSTFHKAEVEKWWTIIKAANIKPE